MPSPIVMTHLLAASTFISHWWEYYFVPTNDVWWKGAVWGNVFAILPSLPVVGVLGVIGYFFHKRAMEPLHARVVQLERHNQDRHKEHVALLGELMDALDPDSEGGISDVLDRLDETTPGGITTILDRLPPAADGNVPANIAN